MENCPSCGADLPDHEQSCAYCGYTQLVIIDTPPLTNSQPQPDEKQENLADRDANTNVESSYTAPQPGTRLSPLVKGTIIAMICLLVIGGLVASGWSYYLLNRPQPVFYASSKHKQSETLAGATGTTFNISGSKFSPLSAITFLLDNIAITTSQDVRSDISGNVKVDLAVTEKWPLGEHLLTAKDGNNYTTEQGIPVVIVKPGQAHTPGPNGAPPDDTSFRIRLKVILVTNAETGKSSVPSSAETVLNITGRPDPAGGTVCQISAITEGSTTYVRDGEQITVSITSICKDESLYKAGQLTLTEIITQWQLSYSSGRTCNLREPYTTTMTGTFISPTTIRGEAIQPRTEFDCTDSTSFYMYGSTNTWEGYIVTD